MSDIVSIGDEAHHGATSYLLTSKGRGGSGKRRKMNIYKCTNGNCGREETNKKNLSLLKSGYPDVQVEHRCGLCGSEIKIIKK